MDFLGILVFISVAALVHGDPGEPLILNSYIESGNIQEGKNAARVGPLKEGVDVESYSGYITVDKKFNSTLFFWYFPAEVNKDTAPVIIYVEGTASALLSIFTLNGAYYINSSNELSRREYYWSKTYNVIYVDNPVGIGYSYTGSDAGYVRNQTVAAENLYTFLTQFFSLFPELVQNEFYIVGESYGAKYSTGLGYIIHRKNPSARVKINLQGIAIACPFLDPLSEMNFAQHFFEIGLIDENTKKMAVHKENEIMRLIRAKQWSNATTSFFAYFDFFGNVTGFQYWQNFLKWNSSEDETYWNYVQTDRVRAAIHVGNNSIGSVESVYAYLWDDYLQSVKPWFEVLVEKYRIILFPGQLDLSIPYPQILNFIRHLNKWSSAQEYRTAKRSQWRVDGDLAGYTKTAGKLTEAIVRNAGHLLIREQSKWVIDLLNRFIEQKNFSQ